MPGYKIKAIKERALVYFAQNESSLLETSWSQERVLYARVASLSRCAHLSIFVLKWTIVFALSRPSPHGPGGMLISKIKCDYHNVVGLLAALFFKFLDEKESD